MKRTLIKEDIGNQIFKVVKRLFPLNRSLTGEDNRKSLKILNRICKNIKILEFKSGKKVFDWKVPAEWNVTDAYIKINQKKIVDFKKNNLHLMSYSEPINKIINFKELNKNLYSIENKPDAIPYVTSYYKRRWGFCLSDNFRKKLNKKLNYEVCIDSSFNKKGSMSIGEIYIKGKVKEEILLSTNICHPSMVNNELCAPVILSFISKYFKNKKNYYSIRILFLPETVGCIAYLNKNLKYLKKNFRAGFHVSCFGDKGKFSIINTKYENSYSDYIGKKVLKTYGKYKSYPFKYCGSDERQYNYPGVDIPVATLTKTKFGIFKEYHNSFDNLNITNASTLKKSFNLIKDLIYEINKDKKLKIKNSTVINKKFLLKKHINKNYNLKIYSKTRCEPFLSKRNLYRDLSKDLLTNNELIMFNILYYGDGIKISDVSKLLKEKCSKVLTIAKTLEKNKLITLIK